jgi:hypothetical protein
LGEIFDGTCGMTFDEAVAFAREELAQLDNMSTSSHRMSVHVEHMADISEGLEYPSWIEKSTFSTLHWDAISMHCIKLLNSSEPISPPLRAWIAEVLASELVGKRARPAVPGPERKGRKDDKNAREVWLWLVVGQLVNKGLTAMRNDEAKMHESAIDAVAKAMMQLGKTPNTFDGIKKIYGRRHAEDSARFARTMAALEAGTDPFE